MMQVSEELGKYAPDKDAEGDVIIHIKDPSKISATEFFKVLDSILDLPYATWNGIYFDSPNEVSSNIYFKDIKKVKKSVEKVLGPPSDPFNKNRKGTDWSMEWHCEYRDFNSIEKLGCSPNPTPYVYCTSGFCDLSIVYWLED